MNKQWKPSKPHQRGIEYCDETRNPVGGCLHRCRWFMPGGSVARCYAEATAEGVAQAAYAHGFEHHYWRDNLDRLVAGTRPRIIFLDSMSDLFGAWVPDEQIEAVLAACASAPHHIFLSLTKAPGRLRKFAHLMPPNFWPGVSSPPDAMMADDSDDTDPVFAFAGVRPSIVLSTQQKNAMLYTSLYTLSRLRREYGLTVWMSFEPLSWNVAPIVASYGNLAWATIGAASDGREKFQPHRTHVSALLTALDAQDTPVFFKGNLEWEPRREDFPVDPDDPHPALVQRQKNAIKYGWSLNSRMPYDAVTAGEMCEHCGGRDDLLYAPAWWTAWGHHAADVNWERNTGLIFVCGRCRHERWIACQGCDEPLQAEFAGHGYEQPDDGFVDVYCPPCAEKNGLKVTCDVGPPPARVVGRS